MLPAEKKSYFKNLLSVACADGCMHCNEKTILNSFGEKLGLKESEIEDILQNPKNVKSIIPKTIEDKLCQLYDMVYIMLIDNEINEIEKKICITIAHRFGFNDSQITLIIDSLINDFRQKIHKNKSILELKEKLQKNVANKSENETSKKDSNENNKETKNEKTENNNK